MRRKVADTIKSQLEKVRTENFLRKPILVCTRTRQTSKDLTEYLKRELRDSDVKKILCLGTYRDYEEAVDAMGKQTVYVVSDSTLKTSLNFSHSVIPLIINYGMAENLQ